MTVEIRALTPADINAVVAFSLRAWAPVFASFLRLVLPGAGLGGPGHCGDRDAGSGPGHQRHGVAAALIDFAVEQLRAAGVNVVAVGTGGDPGHEPARRAYSKAGFLPLPLVRYYKAI
jgi:GNAT superfamily N-acetyltransferase